jgi:hypothetical protein
MQYLAYQKYHGPDSCHYSTKNTRLCTAKLPIVILINYYYINAVTYRIRKRDNYFSVHLTRAP